MTAAVKWTHDALAADLADYLFSISDRMVWVDMQLGPSGSDRPDVYTMAKSYSKPRPMAYEIKVSVANFRSDVTSGKYQKYFDHAAGVTFCVPQGLVNKADVPKGCGLMVRTPEGWHTVKAATMNPYKLKETALLKLLIDGVDRVRRPTIKVKSRELVLHSLSHRSEIGAEFAKYIRGKDHAKHQLTLIEVALQSARDELEKTRTESAAIRKQLTDEAIAQLDKQSSFVEHDVRKLKEVLGLPADAASWELRSKITEVRGWASEDARAKKLRSVLVQAKEHIERQLESLSV